MAKQANPKKGESTRSTPRRRGQDRLSLWQRTLENRALWSALLLIVGGILLMPRESLFVTTLDEGEIASRDYLAGREVMVPDETATQRQREQARSSVLPLYDHDPQLRAKKDEQLQRLFQKGRELVQLSTDSGPDRKPGEKKPAAKAPGEKVPEKATGEEELSGFDLALADLSVNTGLRLQEDGLKVLWDRQFSPELEERVRVLVGQLLRNGVVEDKETLLENRLTGIILRDLQTGEERRRVDLYGFRGKPAEVLEYLESDIRRWPTLTRAERAGLAQLLLNNVEPNYYLNRSETLARREAAAEAADQVFRQIKAGQVIVRKGDMVDSASAAVLEELGGSKRRFARLMPLLGNVLLLTAFILLTGMALRKEWSHREDDNKTMGGVLLLVIVGLASVEIGMVIAHALSESFEKVPFNSLRSYSYAIPFASLALIVSLFYGRILALVAGIGFAILVGRQVGDDAVWAAVYASAGSLAAVYSLDRLKERSAVTRTGIIVGVVNAGSALMLAAYRGLEDQVLASISFDILCAFLGGILLAAVASFAVPILESLLFVTTDIKLIELSDTNLPLLRRLAFEAPGTFQHSLMVANLAKVGCEAINDNAVLAYTSGLYHDIGKVLRPQYFVENQVGENRHDKLAPSMSSLVVINHVKDGVELGQANKLPTPLLDAIRQHHGTRKLAFFYNRAQELLDDDDPELLEDDYRYPGPKPQNKVMGVLMLADGVEAASRALRSPSPARIRTLVTEIFDDCMADNQLDQTNLTLQDMRKIKDEFCRVLESIYHKRVEYPGFAFNEERSGLRVVEGAKS